MDSLYERVMGNADNNEYENDYDYSYEYTPYVPQLSDLAEPEPMLPYSPQDAELSDLYSENFDLGGDDAVSGTGGTSTGATSTGGISGTQNASNQSVAQAVRTSMMGQVAPGLSNAMTNVGRANALGSQFGMGVPGLGPALGIANASPIGMISGLMSLAVPGPLGLIMGAFGKGVSAISSGKAMDAMVGLGIASNSYGPGENVGGSGVSGGQTSGAGTTTGGPTGIGMTGHNDVHGSPMATDPNAEQAAGVAADVAATAEAVASANAAAESVGGGTGVGGTDSGDTSGSGIGSSGGEESGWADGGMIDFYGQGGITSLAYGGTPGYANQAFEGMVPGVGSGMSDDVPFSIEGQQPALLSRDEYVLPADVVSQLGDGSSGAGADMLDGFIDQVRNDKYGNTNQPPPNGQGLIGALQRTV